jgi:hypothetical protein
LPTDPAYATGWDAGMAFGGWYTTTAGTAGTEFDATTAVTASIPVYAKWTFTAGTATVDGETLVHNAPTMATNQGESGTQQNTFSGTANATDGSVTYSAGAVRYIFPTGYTSYDYVTLEYVHSGSLTGILKQGPTTNDYMPIEGGNQYPTLSSSGSYKFRVYTTGTNPGISIQRNAGEGTIKWVNATFSKAVRYTVTFDIGFDEEDDPDVYEEYTSVQVVENTSLGNGLPVPGTRTGWWFLGWFDGENLVTAATLITKNTALIAKWTDVAPAMVEMITARDSGVPVYRFTLTGEEKWSDIKSITFKVRVDETTSYNNTGGRAYVLGNYARSVFNNAGAYVTSNNWNAYRLYNFANSANVGTGILGGTSTNSRQGKWVTFTWDIGPTQADVPSTYRDGAYTATYYPAATATGPFYFGVGITTNSNTITYYIKDVALVKSNGNTIANDDLDTVDGTGSPKLGSFYFAANNSITRAMVAAPSEDDDDD